MLWEKIANIKYTETQSHQLMLLFPPLWMSPTVDVLHWGYSWGLLLFVQAPDVDKEETRKRQLTLTHTTEHLRKMTRRGQHSTPKHKLSGQGEGGKKNRRKGDYDNFLFEVQYTEGLSWSCRTAQHLRHFCWTTTRWFERWRGGDQ